MKIAFVCIGDRPHAKYMVSSFKRNMPNDTIVQIKDEDSPTIEGVDEVYIKPYRGDMMLYMMRGFAELEWDDVLVTTADDCILEGPFSTDGDFDVAIVRRTGDSFASKTFPYTNGLVIVKHKQFYKDCANALSNIQEQVIQGNRLGDWWGDMVAIRDVIDSGQYKVMLLDANRYFKKPKNRGDGNNGEAILWHYSGQRKDWMQDHRYPK